MVGYIAGPAIGATTYDAVHTYSRPVALAAVGLIVHTETAVQLGLIWVTHIAVDRAIGYGLKYPTSFKYTHLQRVSREARRGAWRTFLPRARAFFRLGISSPNDPFLPDDFMYLHTRARIQILLADLPVCDLSSGRRRRLRFGRSENHRLP